MLKKSKIYFSIMAVFCIGCLWAFQCEITANVPWWDDFHGIMLPVYNLFGDMSGLEKFKSFFSLNNEHRVVNDRIFTGILFLIFGKFELKYLAILGFINLILLFFVYLKICKGNTKNYFHLLPLVFIIFQAQYYEGLQSLMVPFQNFSVILYTYLCFYYLSYKKIHKIIPAGIFATLAFFSHGNGVLALMIGIVILLMQQNYKQAIKWSIFSVCIIALYFWGYSKPTWTSDMAPQQGIINSIAYTFQFLGSYSLNITDLSTSISNSNVKLWTSGLFGIAMISIFMFYFTKKYPVNKGFFTEAILKLKHNKTDQFLIATLLFFGATAIIIGITRTGFPMLSRYTINSAFALCSLYLFVLFNLKHKTILASVSIIISLACLIFSYHNTFDIAHFKKNNTIADGLNWKLNGSWASQYSDSAHVGRLNPLLKDIYKDKKYEFPFSNLQIPVFGKNIDSYKENVTLGIVDGYLVVSESNVENKYKVGSENGVYFILKNDSNQFIFPSYRSKQNIFKTLKTLNYFSNIIKADIPIKVIPKVHYEIFRLEIIDNKKLLTKIPSTIGADWMIR